MLMDKELRKIVSQILNFHKKFEGFSLSALNKLTYGGKVNFIQSIVQPPPMELCSFENSDISRQLRKGSALPTSLGYSCQSCRDWSSAFLSVCFVAHLAIENNTLRRPDTSDG